MTCCLPKRPLGSPVSTTFCWAACPRGERRWFAADREPGRHGALEGEPGIYASFEESDATLRQNAQALGFEIESLEQDGRLILINPDLPVSFVKTGEFDIGGLLAILDGHIAKLGAKRVVIDASDVLLRLFRSDDDREDQLFLLYHWLAKHGQTAVLTGPAF